MSVIVINSVFDDAIVPDYVLDYALFREYLVMTMGKKHFGTTTEYDIDEEVKKFENSGDAEKWIAKMRLSV